MCTARMQRNIVIVLCRPLGIEKLRRSDVRRQRNKTGLQQAP